VLFSWERLARVLNCCAYTGAIRKPTSRGNPN
jgi:hypothetical protein